MRNHIPVPPYPDVQKMIDKFPETYQIVKMLRYFESEHNRVNQTLTDSGEGKSCKSWKENKISVQDIVDYVYEQEGLKL